MNKIKFSPLDTLKIWDHVLDYVKPHVGSEVIETWFQPIILESVDGVQAKISVPNKFFGEWLDRNYRDLIAEGVGYGDQERQKQPGGFGQGDRESLRCTES